MSKRATCTNNRPFLYRKERVTFVPSCDEQSVNVSTAEPVRLPDNRRLNFHQKQIVAIVRTRSLDALAASRFLQPITFARSEEKIRVVHVPSSELRAETLHVLQFDLLPDWG
jgi:hypothetical protein